MHPCPPASATALAKPTRRNVLLSAALISAGSAASSARAAETIILYSAQHGQMVDQVIKMFTDQTGIAVRVHSGDAPEIANQIAQEGTNSPADVYFTENSPELVLLQREGTARPCRALDTGGGAREIQRARRPLGRRIRADQCARLQPKAHQRKPVAAIADGPGAARLARQDRDRTKRCRFPAADRCRRGTARPGRGTGWLKGLHQNAKVFDDDEGVIAAVDRGNIATGVINSYYWARLFTEQGATKTRSKIYYFPAGDVGNLVNVSGAAILKSSKHQEAAQKFLAFLVSKSVQTKIAEGNIDFEYPLAAGVPANKLMKPFNELQPPAVTISQLGDDQQAASLLRQAGLL